MRNILFGNVEQPSKPGKGGVGYRVLRTATGFRLLQRGVVLSELLLQPGPTHSVFDVLSALAVTLRPGQPIGLLGFAGGSMLAPLRFLSPSTPVHAVDLDASGYDLFRRHCSSWAGDLTWQQAEAMGWLRRQRRRLSVLIDDLSIRSGRDVIKPEMSTQQLPRLMAAKLAANGVVISNLLQPVHESWPACLAHFNRHFAAVQVVALDEFENRIVVGGRTLPTAQELGRRLRRTLTLLQSHQADQVSVRSLI